MRPYLQRAIQKHHRVVTASSVAQSGENKQHSQRAERGVRFDSDKLPSWFRKEVILLGAPRRKAGAGMKPRGARQHDHIEKTSMQGALVCYCCY